MSRYPYASTSMIPNIIPPQYAESKRDKKRRETVNKIEMLHDDSWRNRDDKFSTLYKEYHNENKSVNTQPPTSSKYLLRVYPLTVERDALIEAAEVDYQYKAALAKKMYENERHIIESTYWEARDQARQRLLSSIEERRRKLREEKEGGDIITEQLLEAQIRPRPTRRIKGSKSPSPPANNDLMLHALLAPALATISTDDIISPNSSSLSIIPASNPAPAAYIAAQTGKRGPRGKDDNNPKDIGAAPGTLTALAIASGQQQPNPALATNASKGSRGAGGVQQGQWVLGKSLADLKKMEQASQLEIESDWARIQGSNGRGRRRGGDQ